MKAITSYRHPGNAAPQEPDTQPGNYYVSTCNDSGAFWLMLGPFPDDHAAALAAVENVRAFTCQHDSTGRAHFMAFGTVRMAHEVTRPGNCNQYLPHLLPTIAA